MNREQKQQAVQNVKEICESSTTIIVAHNHGLTADSSFTLRNKARESGASVQVSKNTLTKIAAQGTDFEGLKDILTGPTVLIYSDDAVSPAKVANDFAKENEDKFTVLGGAFGTQILDVAGVSQLANTPSVDESRAKIVGLLTAGAAKLVGVLQAPAQNVVGVLNAKAEKGE